MWLGSQQRRRRIVLANSGILLVTLAISTKASSHFILPTIPNIKPLYNNSRQQESKKRIAIDLGASRGRKIESTASHDSQLRVDSSHQVIVDAIDSSLAANNSNVDNSSPAIEETSNHSRHEAPEKAWRTSFVESSIGPNAYHMGDRPVRQRTMLDFSINFLISRLTDIYLIEPQRTERANVVKAKAEKPRLCSHGSHCIVYSYDGLSDLIHIPRFATVSSLPPKASELMPNHLQEGKEVNFITFSIISSSSGRIKTIKIEVGIRLSTCLSTSEHSVQVPQRSDPADEKENSALLLSRRTYPPRDS
ncbi:hypothetical protein Tco_0907270 [Tanacetum coccineum]|uniref:Uncharacterized protein n=1 Tax=Tanacetum coccineum TaxID=301880 RepID=A0ABQ5CJS8_9ASTR